MPCTEHRTGTPDIREPESSRASWVPVQPAGREPKGDTGETADPGISVTVLPVLSLEPAPGFC